MNENTKKIMTQAHAMLGNINPDHPWNCYSFVNYVLKQSLPNHNYLALRQYWQNLMADMPEAHRADDIIPYHYACMAISLEKSPTMFIEKVTTALAKPGDLMIYIAAGYDPDLAKQNHQSPPRTHVGFVNKITLNEIKVKMEIIDFSIKRVHGRSKDGLNWTELYPNTIAYSRLTFTKTTKEDELWTCDVAGLLEFRTSLQFLRFL